MLETPPILTTTIGASRSSACATAPRQTGGLVQRLAQQAALHFAVRPVSGGPEGPDPPAVGFDQGDVDPVERGAAHQTYCRQHHRNRAFATPCSNRPADDDQLVPNTDIL